MTNLYHISDSDSLEEKEAQEEAKERFKPLIDWLKGQTNGVVRDGRS